MGSIVKDLLKSLCCSNGWSYGVFWCFDQRNSMLLTSGDAYYEKEEIGTIVNNMLQQVHIVGEGIVGQAALSGKHMWMSLDTNNGACCSAASTGHNDTCQDNSEIYCQFSSGMKTIAVVSVESHGVLQFGSTKPIFETPEFLDQTRRLFSKVENVRLQISPDNLSSSMNSESCDLDEWFASFCNGNITPMCSGSSSELMDVAYSSVNLTQSSALPSEFQQEKMDPLWLDLSDLTKQLHTGAEAGLMLSSNPSNEFELVTSESAITVEKSAAITPCISTLSNEGSILCSLESRLSSEMGVWNSPNVFYTEENVPVSLGCAEKNFQWGSGNTSSYGAGVSFNAENLIQKNFARSKCQATEVGLLQRESGPQKFLEEFKLDDLPTELSNCFPVQGTSKGFTTSEHGISNVAPKLDRNVSQPAGVTSESPDIPYAQPANSVQSSITNSYLCGSQEKPFEIDDLIEYWNMKYGCGQSVGCKGNMMKLVATGGQSTIGTGVSECLPKLDVKSAGGPRKGLFSELGLDELLTGDNNPNYATSSSIDDQFSSAKRRRLGSSSLNQVQSGSISCFSGSTVVQTPYHKDTASNLLSKKEYFPKSQVSLWIDDSYSINNRSALPVTTKNPEEPIRTSKKRARPGESTRPRPKDRQQIQDRIKELKGIIPDGGKCSIDALLNRTIKYMLFLQSLTKYAHKLKEVDKPKLIGNEQELVPKDHNSSGGGATWALEFGDQSTICPIIVEDLSTPGLMLIEMLCDDRGFFLEIADVIQDFGLNILKGVLETRDDKIWAHFIVEAKKHVTRIEVFWSLVQLLQLTSTKGMDSPNQPNNVMKAKIPLLNKYEQPAFQCPISVLDTLQ